MADLSSLEQRAKTELVACTDEAALGTWKTKYLGESSEIEVALKGIRTIPQEQRKAFGQETNRIKTALKQAHEEAVAAVKENALQASLTANPLDVTLPGRPVQRGRLHVA